MSGFRSRMFALRYGSGSLAELHTRHVDMVAGYDKILEFAEPEFQQIVHDFRELHVRQANMVAAMLIEDGEDPAMNGSIFAQVNRAVVVVRAWFDDISVNMIDALVEGEKHVLESLDAAIEALPNSERRRALAASRAELVALLERHGGH